LSASTLCPRIGRFLVGYATFTQTVDLLARNAGDERRCCQCA
jgi:hypothetical protein